MYLICMEKVRRVEVGVKWVIWKMNMAMNMEVYGIGMALDGERYVEEGRGWRYTN